MTVVTHSRFKTDVEGLRALGVDVARHDGYDYIPLDAPKYNEQVLGTLEEDSVALYADLYDTSLEIEDLTRTYMGAAIEKLGTSIRGSDRQKSLQEALAENKHQLEFGTEENRLAFCRLQQRQQVLHATFWWRVGEQFGTHDWHMSVRTGFRVVKLSPKG